MTVLDTTYRSSSAPVSMHSAAAPLLNEISAMPKLLEYRSASDPDSEFIPKTIAGFAMGALAMFLALDFAEPLLYRQMVNGTELLRNFAFMMGIVGVTTSLMLVGVKVRADHCDEQLYARHWLNSIGTGAASSFMIWLPWLLMEHNILPNRFVAAAIWMSLMAFPALAAKWTIGPHPDHARATIT